MVGVTQQQEEADHYQGQNELPDPSYPFGVGYPRHTEDSHQDTGDRGNHIRKPVPELECEDRRLPRNPDKVGKGSHNRHRNGSLGGSRRYEDVYSRLDTVHQCQ